jgi:predicted esterase
MKKYKRELESALLRRSAHADVIEVGKNPQFLFLLFGGSGIDDEEYQKRSQTVIPLFDRVLESRGKAGNCFIFMHVTAPYDIPYNRVATELDAAFLWSSHVREELIEPWTGLPMFVSGFSGGAALALNGLHLDTNCLGGFAFGADAIPNKFELPKHWRNRLRLYAAPNDRVCNGNSNRRIVERLANCDFAEEIVLSRGGHSLADYATDEGVGDAIELAASSIWPKA